MNFEFPKNWLIPTSLDDAKRTQKAMAERVIVDNTFAALNYFGGVDVSNNRFDPKQMIYAAAVLLDKNQLNVHTKHTVAQQQVFPYIPGFLGFREAPAVVQAIQGIHPIPDLIMVDGHGISHPRRLGIASHIGVLLDIPTIGVAKSILVGKPEGVLGPSTGDQVPLVWKGETIGMLLRTKPRSNPLIISIGHRVNLNTAVNLVLECLKGYRLPEPTRQAHLAANECRKSFTL